MAKAQIERFMGRETPHPAIPGIGRSRQRAARQGLTRHQHEVYEICLITDGEADWFQDDTAFHLLPGTVFVTRPGVEHGSVSGRFQPCTLAWLQVDHRRLANPGLARDLENIWRWVWVDPQSDALLTLHEQLLRECRRPQADSSRAAKALLTLLLTHVIRGSRGKPHLEKTPELLRRMLRLIDQHDHGRLSLADLQEASGLSRSRVHELFRQHLGQSPGSILLQKRLQRAQTLLRDPARSITRIAYELDFSSSQHFAKAFRTRFGVSPTAFRNGEF